MDHLNNVAFFYESIGGNQYRATYLFVAGDKYCGSQVVSNRIVKIDARL